MGLWVIIDAVWEIVLYICTVEAPINVYIVALAMHRLDVRILGPYVCSRNF